MMQESSVTITSYLAFVGLAALLTVTPGPDSLLTLRFALRDRPSGFAASAGSAVATLLWAALVAVGLASLLEQSAELYRALKVIGGLYLVCLGIAAIRKARRPLDEVGAAKRRGSAGRLRSASVAGFLSSMTNPKLGLFFVAVLPQFVPQNEAALANTMLLGATYSAVTFVYLALLSLVSHRASVLLRRPRVTAAVEAGSGAVLVALGIGTAASAAQPA